MKPALRIILVYSFLFFNQNFVFAQQKSVKITEHFSNGKLKFSGHQLDESKYGFWFFYLENGKLEHKEKWKNGNLIWAIYYNERGRRARAIDKNGNEKKYKGCGC